MFPLRTLPTLGGLFEIHQRKLLWYAANSFAMRILVSSL